MRSSYPLRTTTPRCARLALAVLALAGAMAAAAAPETTEWRFRVLLDDSEIGYHTFRLSNAGEQQVVESEARFSVRILLFEAYRYEHNSREVWQGDCLRRIDATTNDNGERYWVEGRLSNGGFRVDSRSGERVLDACPMTFAYWNPAMLRAPRLLNAQTGEYLESEVVATGQRSVRVAGSDVDGEIWRLATKDQVLELWYGVGGRWLGLQTQTESGRQLRYELEVLPSLVALAPYLSEWRGESRAP